MCRAAGVLRDPPTRSTRRRLLPIRRFLLASILVSTAACGDGGSGYRFAATPIPTPSVAPACFVREVVFEIDGAASDLDLGSTGINYDTTLPRGLSLRLQAECGATDASGCGSCVFTGLGAESRRCLADVSRSCRVDGDCPTGRCADLFAPPIPLSAGGAPSCVLKEVVALGPGSFDPATNATTLPITLDWTFFAGRDLGVPCPVCSGNALGDAGVCQGGLRDGAPCVVGASDALLGNTSYDCPPNPEADLGGFIFSITLTTATAALAPEQRCVGTAFAGAPCYCAAQTAANACNGGRCETTESGDGVCVDGPVDGLCVVESFRGCRDDAGCPLAGDRCGSRHRECLGGAGENGNARESLLRTGRAQADEALLVGLSCVPPGTNAVLNDGLGLPAAVSWRIPTRIATRERCEGRSAGK